MTRWFGLGARLHPGQVLLRGSVVLGALLSVLAAGAAGSVPRWLELAVTLVALVAVGRPDSLVGLLLVALVGQAWLSQPDGSVTSPWLLVSAAGIVVAHLGLLVAAQGPASARPDPVQIRTWCTRGVGLWLAAAVVWLLARWVQGATAPGTVLVAALVLLVGATVWVTSRLTGSDPSP